MLKYRLGPRRIIEVRRPRRQIPAGRAGREGLGTGSDHRPTSGNTCIQGAFWPSLTGGSVITTGSKRAFRLVEFEAKTR
jgi:hypothetical protein